MARWAHGTMQYRGQRYANPRRRRNPGNGNGGSRRGGMSTGTIVLIGGAALLFFMRGRSGAGTVPTGFTPTPTPGLYRGPDGVLYARHPQTGQMVRAPAGTTPTSVSDLLLRAGVQAIPSVAGGIADWLGGLFSGQQTATGLIPSPGGTTSPAPRPPTTSTGTMPLPPLLPIPSWGAEQAEGLYDTPGTLLPGDTGYTAGPTAETEYAAAPYLTPLAPLPGGTGDAGEIDYAAYDWSQYDWSTYDWGAAYQDAPELFPQFAALPEIGTGDFSLEAFWSTDVAWPEVSFDAPVDDSFMYEEWAGFEGPRRGFAKFGRRPPSYR